MDKALFASGNTEWETPQDFFDILNKVCNFDIDVCATAKNAKCKNYFNKEQDGLSKEWHGTAWCNPPYGRDVEKWVKKAVDECHKNHTRVVMLLPARTDTNWIHKHVFGTAKVIFLKGRLKFGNCVNTAPFPSMLALYGCHDEMVKVLAIYLNGYAVLKDYCGSKL